jgi:curved DNA binding protein
MIFCAIKPDGGLRFKFFLFLMEVVDTENQLEPQVVTKYQIAAEICSKALKIVLDQIAPGKVVNDLLKLGNESINDISKSVYGKTKLKGIAFPTCLSVNQFVCHFSPLESDPESQMVLKEGDVVRVELGAHVDGYIAQQAHTVVLGGAEITGKQADVLKAVHTLGEIAVRAIKPGNTNTQVSKLLESCCEDFGVKPVQGSTMHEMKRNVMEGKKRIVLNRQEGEAVDEVTFEEGEVYTVDLLVTTGDGKLKLSDIRTTVFKRNPDTVYQLKLSTSRKVFSEISQKCGTMAFSLRQLEDEKKARMGITESVTHQLVSSYPVMQEKEGEAVAHLVYTVLLMPNGPLRLTNSTLDERVKSEKEVTNEELVALLKSAIRKKKKNKK